MNIARPPEDSGWSRPPRAAYCYRDSVRVRLTGGAGLRPGSGSGSGSPSGAGSASASATSLVLPGSISSAAGDTVTCRRPAAEPLLPSWRWHGT